MSGQEATIEAPDATGGPPGPSPWTAERLWGPAAATFLMRAGGAGMAFLTALLAARLLGAAGFGVYSLALAWAGFLTLGAQLGLPTLIVRLVASHRAREEWGLVKGLLRRSHQGILIASLLVALLAAAGGWIALGGAGAGSLAAFLAALCLLPLASLLQLRQAALQGLGNIVASQSAELVLRPLLVLGLVVLLCVLARGELTPALPPPLLPSLVIACHALATLAAVGFLSLALRAALPGACRAAGPSYRTAAWARSALHFLLVSVIHALSSQADVLILGAWAAPGTLGPYTAAARFASLVNFVLVAVNTVLAPAIARLHARGERERLQRTVSRGTRGALVLAALVALPLLIGDRFFLGLFGKGFEEAALPLWILIGGQLANVAFGPVGMVLLMTGHEREVSRGLALGAAANIALNLCLVPPWGAGGAAVAGAASTVLWNAALALRVRQLLGIDATALGKLPRGARRDEP